RHRSQRTGECEAPESRGLARALAPLLGADSVGQEAPKPGSAEHGDHEVRRDPRENDCEWPTAEGKRDTDEDDLKGRPQKAFERPCTGEEVSDADVDAESSRCFDDDEERRRREDDACVVPRE